MWERTIAVFHADHGLSLGEYGVAGKGELFDAMAPFPALSKEATSARATLL